MTSLYADPTVASEKPLLPKERPKDEVTDAAPGQGVSGPPGPIRPVPHYKKGVAAHKTPFFPSRSVQDGDEDGVVKYVKKKLDISADRIWEGDPIRIRDKATRSLQLLTGTDGKEAKT
ncbi:unnamed protein product [Amoebophrya sp. A25]|nr:unnamed protein product [Amoebophrya sp. A25]|eukprot:GSA25T00025366001.1